MEGEARIVLVIEASGDLASVVLAHNEIDLRTDRDIFVAGAETGLPFPLAVETDVVGPVSRLS